MEALQSESSWLAVLQNGAERKLELFEQIQLHSLAVVDKKAADRRHRGTMVVTQLART